MIGYLEGEWRAPNLLRTGGIGYLVHTPHLFEDHERVSLHITPVIREDAFDLYGFLTTAENEFFQILRRATGVGPKMALGILTQIGAAAAAAAIANDDIATLTTCKGVGAKTARNITNAVTISPDLLDELGAVNTAPATPEPAPVDDDLHLALVALGYTDAEAADSAAAARAAHPDADTNSLLRAAMSTGAVA